MNQKYNLQIGFIGFNREQTINNFKSFIEINKEQIKEINLINYECILDDNTIIKCIFRAKKYTEQFDQLILSDDSRFMVKQVLRDFDFSLSNHLAPEFQFIEDNIDSEVN